MFRTTLLATLASSVLLLGIHAQSAPQPSDSTGKSAAPVPADSSHANAAPHRYQSKLPDSATQYYTLFWGVDNFTVRSVESGELIKFSYRVRDVSKAQALNDKKNEPALICPRAGVKLVVPSMEKVGKLRQSSAPEEGKVYWMAFSNKGRLVKPGDHVNVVIGDFHVDGIIVQ